MSQDPYSPCVCGSGKKLKFCCQDILSEMIRVEKLVENQPDAAEKLLRQLLTKHSDKEVVVTRLSGILVNKGEYQEARTLLVDFLKAQPDEPRALLALARSLALCFRAPLAPPLPLARRFDADDGAPPLAPASERKSVTSSIEKPSR